LPFQIDLTTGVIEKGIAWLDKMQENDLALTLEDQQSIVLNMDFGALGNGAAL